MMEILGTRTDKRHVLMYCRRWLQAQVWKRDGTFADRDEGTPQGGVISPLLANIFLDEVFDRWMAATCPGTPFERYADDIVVHAASEREARELRDRIRQRLGEYGLRVNEEKTRVVYCWRAGRPPRSREELPQEFDFLGFTFKPRLLTRRSDKRTFWGFWPGISRKNELRIADVLRKLSITKWQGMTLREVAKALAPRTRGWISYYGRYSPGEMGRVMNVLNTRLVKWARRKFDFPLFSSARGWLCSQEIRKTAQFHHWSKGFGMWQYLLRRAV
jgi:group II intron reverse transcriptase/maturase